MEPCLFRHGKRGRGSPVSWSFELQWSHVFSDMVSVVALAYPVSLPQLQWSHVFSDMVSSRASSSSSTIRSPLQWSHVFSDMVSGTAPRISRQSPCASMEPCLFRHGKRSRR